MCEPDFNAYSMEINHKPFCEDWTLRSAGGHIHLGYDNIEVPFDDKIFKYKADEQRAEIVKTLDLFLGIPSVIMEPDNKRKDLYGCAGAYRPKSYGVEYRTISNFYLVNNKLRRWAFTSVKDAIKFLNKNGKLDNSLADHVRSTINSNDKDQAIELIKEFNLQLV